MKSGVERRRFRRAELDVSVTIHPLPGQDGASAPPFVGRIKDLSLAGFYGHVKASCSLKVGDLAMCSIVIPPEQSRWFPFTRVTGKGSVVRLDSIPEGRRVGDSPPNGEPLLGMAVAFAPNVTALGSIESMY